jgi:hypothetical protein
MSPIGIAVLAALACLAAATNPLLMTAVSDPCYALDTPHAELCFPTRCMHLFNHSRGTYGGALVPTPMDYPQSYGAFGCNVSTVYEYGPELPSRACLKPVCYCKKYQLGGTCNPARFQGCQYHSCTPNNQAFG